MGIFSNTTPFDADIEKVTDEKNTSEDWGLIMDLCDRVQATNTGPRDCLKAIVKRLNHQDPHVVMQAITLLDACVNNCGKYFMLEVASREFETEFKKLLGKSHPKVQEKLKAMLKKWAEGDFKSDSSYSLIPSLYHNLRREGIDFSSSGEGAKKVSIPKDPNVVSTQQEEADIARAIQLSLEEAKSSPQARKSTSAPESSLYPSTNTLSVASGGGAEAKNQKKGRALYDFEAAEDNELTFKAGEIVIILDDSDVNWWKGSNHRGEGLFPSNFVTTDLEAEPEQFKEDKRRRSVQFNEEVEVKTLSEPLEPVEINEDRIDKVLMLLHEADPTSPETDSPELPGLEDQVNGMGPLIDQELEVVDRRHAQLTRLSTELVDALNLYHQLMREMPPPAMYAPQMMPPPPQGYQPAPMGYPQSYAGPASFASNGYGYAPQQPVYSTADMQPSEQQYYPSTAPPPTPPLNELYHQNPPGVSPYAMNGAPYQPPSSEQQPIL